MKFNRDQLVELRRDAALTSEQVEALERVLPSIAFDLQPAVRAREVRDHLYALAKSLSEAEKRVQRWELAAKYAALAAKGIHRGRTPAAVALGALNLRSTAAALPPRPDDSTWPEYVVGSEVIKLAALLAKNALANQPARWTPGRTAAWRAIESIVDALRRPGDAASVSAARALAVTRSDWPTAKPSFRRVAEIAFGAATEGEVCNPERAIAAYLKRQGGARA